MKVKLLKTVAALSIVSAFMMTGTASADSYEHGYHHYNHYHDHYGHTYHTSEYPFIW